MNTMYRKLVLYVIVVAMAQGGAVTFDYMADDGAVKLLHGDVCPVNLLPCPVRVSVTE